MPTEGPTIVVVGGVAGGASAAARARRCNETARIVIFEKDGYVSFANCGLPYYIGGEIAVREKLLVAPIERFRDRFNIDVHTGHAVETVDRARRVVSVRRVETGEVFEQPYDKLILAPGAAPIVPPIAGVDAPNVFTLRNLEDTDRIKAYIERHEVRRAVVAGAGFIGLEMVEQLHGLGIPVGLVELAPQVLPPLDPEMAKFVQEELDKRNIDVDLGHGISGIKLREGRAEGVSLDNNASRQGDLIILAVGVRPNVQLAKDSGLVLGPMGGIAVNEYMQTSDPDVYAVGDAVEYPRTYLGRPARIPLAGPANKAGRIAGEHAATGKAHPMPLVQGTAIVRVFDKTAGSTGLSEKTAEREGVPVRCVYVAGGHHAGYYPGAETLVLKLLYTDGGAIRGAQCVGGEGVDKRLDIIATAMQMGATVYDLAGFDLAYAPPFGSAKDPVHMAAFAACNDLDGIDTVAPIRTDLGNVQVVDVRTAAEFAECRIPGAHHIPVDELRNRLNELDPEKPTVTLCHSGQRAHVAACLLKQRGFRDVNTLTGGMLVRRRARPKSVQYGD